MILEIILGTIPAFLLGVAAMFYKLRNYQKKLLSSIETGLESIAERERLIAKNLADRQIFEDKVSTEVSENRAILAQKAVASITERPKEVIVANLPDNPANTKEVP